MTIDRAKVSVCMAAYQGERYIAAQLWSILEQLGEGDEVIVVDDHSSDGTCAVVRAIDDARIRLIRRETNQGVARTFEEALSHASGEIIFLSDQDDLWMPGRVTKTLEVFTKNAAVTLVATDASLMDEHGEEIGSSYYAERGRFRPGFLTNLLRCKFLGCTMAFRSEVLAKAIPFPSGSDVLHDIWIGTVNSLKGGKTCYIDQRLVKYRRHAAAATGEKLRLGRQIRIRLQLLRAAVELLQRNREVRAEGRAVKGVATRDTP
jgi:glycosyltransferase involved in cell wall biosynthesis